jgi:hypothetical protein
VRDVEERRAAQPDSAPAGPVADVVVRLEQIASGVPAADGVACFTRMYLTVTRLVGERLGVGFFADPDRMVALDVTFAGLFLEAVEADQAGRSVPKAWAPLFARRGDRRVTPLQFALAGMNAHINHDLPLAVVATASHGGFTPRTRGFHQDYLKVNQLLAQVDRQVRQSYLDGIVLQADREASPVLDLVSTWSIDRARDAAWVNADVLWHLRDVGFLRDAFADTLARSVGLVTSTLLAPLET